MAPVKCVRCDKAPTSKEILVCSICKHTYDIECASVTYARWSLMNPKQRTSWKCSTCCEQALRTAQNDSSSVSTRARTSKPTNDVHSNTPSPTKNNDESSLVKEMQLFRAEFAALRLELTNINSNFEKLSLAVNTLENRIGTLEQRVQTLEERPDPPTSEQSDLKELTDTVERLKLELNERDQELLSTDIEISGIAEQNSENPIHLAVLVAQKLNVEIEVRDIVSAERVGLRRVAGDGDGGSDGRPRTLAVRLARRAQRDELLRAARRARGADTAGFDLPGPPRKFYVNERLTRANRQLFYKARHEGARANWRYIWTRDGRIYARHQPNTQAQRIRTDEDLTKIFGIAPV
ncbi:uncharacterized protein LOC134666322 [Cydia fagiglandana]|uniref:uncharacterized protein LOC134666322 n=1 Tax=Cydia fagiglandana TaxID=1458189 RepID=UPI002FEE233B